MTVVIDNCLPLSWTEYLRQRGHAGRHWRELGPPNAPDVDILPGPSKMTRWFLPKTSISRNCFSKAAPRCLSVIPLRLDDVRPTHIGEDVLLVLDRYRDQLQRGALITIKGRKSRLRLLPLGD